MPTPDYGFRWPLGEPLSCICHLGWPKPKAWACEYGGVHRNDARHGRGVHHAEDLPLYTVRQVEEIQRRGGVVAGALADALNTTGDGARQPEGAAQ